MIQWTQLFSYISERQCWYYICDRNKLKNPNDFGDSPILILSLSEFPGKIYLV